MTAHEGEHMYRQVKQTLAMFLVVVSTACALKQAPILVGETGVAVVASIGEMQVLTRSLTDAKVLTPAQALTVQETLLRVNDRLKPLPSLVRALDAAQQAGKPDLTLVEQALALVQAASGELGLIIDGLPVAPAVKQLLDLAQATRTTVTTLITNLTTLRDQLKSSQ